MKLNKSRSLKIKSLTLIRSFRVGSWKLSKSEKMLLKAKIFFLLEAHTGAYGKCALLLSGNDYSPKCPNPTIPTFLFILSFYWLTVIIKHHFHKTLHMCISVAERFLLEINELSQMYVASLNFVSFNGTVVMFASSCMYYIMLLVDGYFDSL